MRRLDESGPPRADYRPAIDGLRAVAIGAVLAFHSGFAWAPGGFLGVSLFFTVSGYLITTLLLAEHERTGRIDLRGFWERRFRRLAPAAIVVLAGVTLAAPQFADFSQRASLRGDVLGALAYVANWRFLAHGESYAALFRTPSPVQHFWSLSIEEQYYVAYPLVVAGVFACWRRAPRRALGFALAALAAASLASQLLASSFDRVYYGTDTRLFEIVAGALLAVVTYARRDVLAQFGRAAAVVGSVGVAVFAALVARASLGGGWLAHGGLALVALVNVALLVAALAPGPFARVLGVRPLAAVGRVSYGLYLVHWPVFLWLDAHRTGLHGAALLAARLGVVVPLTLASYRLLEMPVRVARRLRTRPRFTASFSVGVAATIALVLAAPTVAAPVTDAAAVARVTRSVAAHAPRPPPPLRIMVVGDSTGSTVARALAAAAHDRLLVEDATDSCPILPARYLRAYAGAPVRDVTSCVSRPLHWLARADAFHPAVVFVVESVGDASEISSDRNGPWTDVNDMWVDRALLGAYRDVAKVLRTTGAVVAWANAPPFRFATTMGANAAAFLDRRVALINEAIAQATAAELGVVRLDLAAHVALPRSAPDRAARPDGVHLTTAAAVTAARAWLVDALLSAYRDGERELGVDVTGPGTAPVRVFVTGDSTSLGVAAGLAQHGGVHGDVVVDWAGQPTCSVLHAQYLRFPDGVSWPVSGCPNFPALWADHLRTFHPDVVLVVSSVTDASDLDFGRGWEHIGQRRYDDALRAVMHAAISQFQTGGARVVWASAPCADLGDDAADRVLAARVRLLNGIITTVATQSRATVLPLAAHLDRSGCNVDRRDRPDGVHLSVDGGLRLADAWLAHDVVHAAMS